MIAGIMCIPEETDAYMRIVVAIVDIETLETVEGSIFWRHTLYEESTAANVGIRED